MGGSRQTFKAGETSLAFIPTMIFFSPLCPHCTPPMAILLSGETALSLFPLRANLNQSLSSAGISCIGNLQPD